MKNYAFLPAALAGCTQQRPVVLAPVRMEIPDPSVPDWNPSNDTWGNPPSANPAGAVTRK